VGRTLLIYGANGYTGRLVAAQAVAEGLAPMLAGRDARAVAGLAAELGLPHAAFPLDDTAALERALSATGVVLHCAGPFSATSRPMADACLRTGGHYLDLTGELAVLQQAQPLLDRVRALREQLTPQEGS
jgi:short subunit dehydrogenase-like uncharacterized protein